MAQLSETYVRGLLGTLRDTYAGIDLVSLGWVRGIGIDGGRVSVDLRAGYPLGGLRDALVAEFRRRLRTKGRVFAISAATGEGCRELATEIARFLQAERRAEQADDSSDAGPASPEKLA